MYLICPKDHYVQRRRGETLEVGDKCPSTIGGYKCGLRLRPAPEESETCSTCKRGVLVPTEVDGVATKSCSACGATRAIPVAGSGPSGSTYGMG